LKTLRPLMPNNVALRTEGVDPCYVAGDATQIHQIILNVCINAAQAIGDRDGRVSVSIQQVDVDDGMDLVRSVAEGLRDGAEFECWRHDPHRTDGAVNVV
ncbi:MAG: hypothetical protein RLN74_05305, partial [Ilumatobacter fluminis]